MGAVRLKSLPKVSELVITGGLLVPVPVGRDGQIGEENRDGQHAHVQVMEQVCHLMEHALPHLPTCVWRQDQYTGYGHPLLILELCQAAQK